MNLGIWAWLYNWRERKRIRKAIDKRRDGIVSCPPTHGKFLYLFLIPVKSFDPIPLSLDALKGGNISKIYLDGK